jgi:hypothetical protein
MSRLTPEQRRTLAKAAALARWSRLDDDERSAATAKARAALDARFDAAPNPDAARRAHYTRLALASSRKRTA